MRFRDPPLTPPPPHPQPTDHAILVGIQHYALGIPQLQGSINDCDLFSRWLADRDGGGLDPANIKCLTSTDPTDDQPFRDQVEDLILEYYDGRAQTGLPVGRRLYLFFSGHGVAPPAPIDDDCALVMANATLARLRALIGGLAARKIRKAALFEEVMLVMDCCREVSGAVVAACDLPDASDPTLRDRPFLHIVAARWGSVAAERPLPDPLDPRRASSWHGVLTHALIRGLVGAVDSDGNVTAVSLKKFVRRAVEEILGGDKQYWPAIQWDETLDPMAFGTSRGVRVDVRLTAPKTKLRIRHGVDLAELTPPRKTVRGAIRVWLKPGLYLFEAVSADGTVVAASDHKVLEAAIDVTL